MPKTAKNLWNKIVSFDNLLRAFYTVCKKDNGNKYEALLFKERLDENIIALLNALIWKSWVPGPFTCHYVYEPKRRYVEAPCFSDRVVHEAICSVLSPLFDRRFIENTFACRKGKGTLHCSLSLRKMLRSAQKHAHGRKMYFLKADISKYYPSINHCKLWDAICRVIADKDVLWLLHTIIFDCGYDQYGLPIGSQTSQLFANVYLDKFDHYVKSELRVRYYTRYMDDMVILAYDKKYLHELKEKLGVWLNEELELTWNPKTCVAPVSHGINYAGYRHWSTHTLPRIKNVKKQRANFKRLTRLFAEGKTTLEHVRNVVTSFTGYMKHCNGERTAKSTLKYLVLRRPK